MSEVLLGTPDPVKDVAGYNKWWWKRYGRLCVKRNPFWYIKKEGGVYTLVSKEGYTKFWQLPLPSVMELQAILEDLGVSYKATIMSFSRNAARVTVKVENLLG
jgi:hypothetical protein